MKILYVEDELSKNIPRIMSLFAIYLGEKRLKELESLEKDETGYGATPEEIKKIVEDTNVIDVEYHFPDALRKVIHYYNQYGLFIIDRNLRESEYTLGEVQKIDPDYDEQRDEAYSEREGDYLFLKLGQCSNGNALKKVYFLTAYPIQDDLRSRQEVVHLIDRWRIQIRDFIEKGNHSALKKLQDEVINLNLFKTVRRK